MIRRAVLAQPKGVCSHCGDECRLTDGAEIYTQRPDLWSLNFWLCDTCDAYVGCHKPGDNTRYANADGTAPLGTAANKELRKMRHTIHRRIDPFWERSSDKRAQRRELYAHLTRYGHMKGIVPQGEAFHVSLLTEESAKLFYDLFDDFVSMHYPYGIRVGSRLS